MPRPVFVPKPPAFIDPTKRSVRSSKARIRRTRGKGSPKPRVVLGTAAARALGIGVPA